MKEKTRLYAGLPAECVYPLWISRPWTIDMQVYPFTFPAGVYQKCVAMTRAELDAVATAIEAHLGGQYYITVDDDGIWFFAEDDDFDAVLETIAAAKCEYYEHLDKRWQMERELIAERVDYPCTCMDKYERWLKGEALL